VLADLLDANNIMCNQSKILDMSNNEDVDKKSSNSNTSFGFTSFQIGVPSAFGQRPN